MTFNGRDGPAAEKVGRPIDCYDEFTRNFIAAIHGQDKSRSSIEDGVESLVLTVAESYRAGGAPRKLP